MWLHGYRFNDEHSTCIVECAPETWKGLGLDTLDADAGLVKLQEVFARELDGNELISQTSGRARRPG